MRGERVSAVLFTAFTALVVTVCAPTAGAEEPSPWRARATGRPAWLRVFRHDPTGACFVGSYTGNGGGLAEAPREVCEAVFGR